MANTKPEKTEPVTPAAPAKKPPEPEPSWRRMSLYDPPASPSSLYDLRTQSEVLARLLVEPDLLQEPFGDLTVSDFGGKVHQSLFRTLLRLSQEGKPFDVTTVAESWGAEKEVADPIAYVSQMLDTVGTDFPSTKLRLRVEKLHSLSHLRQLRFFGETVQRHAESAQTDPHALIEKIEFAVQALRAGYDVNGQLLPYAPRNLARRPDLITLSSVEPQPVPWLWRPYLVYGMLNMLSGDPGAGKTYLALAFAAALTVGKIPYTGEPCLPLDVIYLSTENSPEFVLRARFDALAGDANRLHVLQGVMTGEGPKVRRESVRLSDIATLEAAVKEKKARLLVIDPIQSYLGGEVDLHRSNETRPILDGLATLAQRHKVCILILRHFAKATTGHAIHRGLGSIDLTGAARTELHAGYRDQQRAMVHAKTNIGEIGKSIGYEIGGDGIFRWTGETSITANDLAASGMPQEDRDAVNEAAECLSDLLRGGPKLTNEIFSEMKDLGVSNATVRRAKAKLGVQSRKRSGQRGQFEWVLDGYEEGEVSAS
jgi:hypothetical protein